ncbi:CD209 antigen-like protein C [Pimephales promelas]|uniref:CD209 antigen-like protein C n=1 Tax=Pimephales promelas TaxID=90988 RepID=UPI001955E56B|nr:CD209 antigen-like protein C [Pimephales promelas]
MESDIYYVNFGKSDSKGTTSPPQLPSRPKDHGKAKKSRESRCLVLMAVGLVLICALQLVNSSTGVLQFIMITEERDLLKTYMNTVEEFSQTIKSLQDNYNDLINEKDQLQKNFSSLSQKKLELENKVTSLRVELNEAYERSYQLGSIFISVELKNWYESRQYCRNRGGDLIIINTEEKQSFITTLVTEGAWIGLSDIQLEGKMTWVDNSTLKQGFWELGEPNNSGNEDCVERRASRPFLNWNDIPCSFLRQGICEK